MAALAPRLEALFCLLLDVFFRRSNRVLATPTRDDDRVSDEIERAGENLISVSFFLDRRSVALQEVNPPVYGNTLSFSKRLLKGFANIWFQVIPNGLPVAFRCVVTREVFCVVVISIGEISSLDVFRLGAAILLRVGRFAWK